MKRKTTQTIHIPTAPFEVAVEGFNEAVNEFEGLQLVLVFAQATHDEKEAGVPVGRSSQSTCTHTCKRRTWENERNRKKKKLTVVLTNTLDRLTEPL